MKNFELEGRLWRHILRSRPTKANRGVCSAIGGYKTRHVAITEGFDLPAKYIIHAVGPIWTGGKNGEPDLLYSAYKSSLNVAMDNDCHTIGFPLISAGIYGYPLDDAWE